MHDVVFKHPPKAKLGLSLGPFRYAFLAYCAWGESIIAGIRRHLHTSEMRVTDKDDRVIHLIPGAGHPRAHNDILESLPGALYDLSGTSLDNPINTLWMADNSRHVVWTASSRLSSGKPRFELPWSVLIRDITAIGGGLLHTGLACHNGSGLLFLAPPTGGKTTTLSTSPEDWQVLSDDAALVWPDASGAWLASPLPAWGAIINPERDWSDVTTRLDQTCRLKSLLVLHKALRVSLSPIPCSKTMPHVYRAFSEYPVTILAEAAQAEPWFRAAAKLCRDLSCWELHLPRHADIWPLISQEAA